MFGVKGHPWFSYLQLFNIIRVVAIDYINCVLLGIVKMHLTLWFDKTHRNEPFSIAPKISEVDKCLHAIKPPSFITRFPRSLIEIAHFKSAELKTFFRFYSLPCLVGVLLGEQFLHFSLRVFFTYKLLQDKISSRDLIHCMQMILDLTWISLFCMLKDTALPTFTFSST